MNPSILGLRTTIYKVSNLQEAKTWYSKVFGVLPYFDEPYYVGFNIGGYELGLQSEETAKGDNIAVFWGVDNMTESCKHFVESGARAVEKPTNVGDEIIVATFRDPWDNLIGIIYNPEFHLPN